MPTILLQLYGVFATTLTRKGIIFYINDHCKTGLVQRMVIKTMKRHKILKYLPAWDLTVQGRQKNGMVSIATGPILLWQARKPLKPSMTNGHSLALARFFLRL